MGLGVRGWIGFVAPTGVPRDIRMKLAAESQKILDSAEMKERLLAAGLEPSTQTPDEFAQFVRAQNERFGAIARQANIKTQ